ncbi:MAG: S9 family peptidase [Caldisericia bacterium]|nr:S9 family peptidase [Caldisericia bacterium]
MKLDHDKTNFWKQRVRQPKISNFGFARMNHNVATLECNKDGCDKTYIWDIKTGQLNDLLGDGAKHYGYLSPDGRYWYYLKDTKGNELGHWHRIEISSGVTEDITPDLPLYSGYSMSISDDSKKIAIFSYFEEDKRVYVISLDENFETIKRNMVFQSINNIDGIAISGDGKLVAISSDEGRKNNKQATLIIDTETGDTLHRLWLGDDKSVFTELFISNTSLAAVLVENKIMKSGIWNYKNGEFEIIELNAEGDQSVRDVSSDGKLLLLESMYKSQSCHYVYSIERKTSVKLEDLNGETWPECFVGNDLYLLNNNSQEKSALKMFDGQTGRYKGLAFQLPDSIPSSKAELVTFKGANGDNVDAWFKKPEGVGPFPAIIQVHGGPLVFNGEYYEDDAFVDNGFAKLSVNYHGTYSYGESFDKSIIGRIGEFELEDMVAASNWLVELRIAIPDKIFLMGGSYGGYLTLWGMVKRPDLWRAGIAHIPVTDWKMTHEDSTDFMKAWTIQLFEGKPEEKPEQYVKSSPITYVENLSAPIFITAGINDTRCAKRQNQNFIAKAKDLGKDVEEYWFDEGQGSNVVDEQIHQIELRLRFMKRVLEK